VAPPFVPVALALIIDEGRGLWECLSSQKVTKTTRYSQGRTMERGGEVLGGARESVDLLRECTEVFCTHHNLIIVSLHNLASTP
jgi:hypothetical protein